MQIYISNINSKKYTNDLNVTNNLGINLNEKNLCQEKYISTYQVISLKTRLTHQEATIQQLHNIRRQMEEVFEKEKGLLHVQKEQDKQTIQQLEVRLDIARRTIQDTKETQAAVEKEWLQVQLIYIHVFFIVYFHEIYFNYLYLDKKQFGKKDSVIVE